MAAHGEVEEDFHDEGLENRGGHEMATHASDNWLVSAKNSVAKWFTNLSLTTVGESLWSVAPYTARLGGLIMPIAPLEGAAIAVLPAAAGLAISGLGVKRASGSEKAVWGLSHIAAAAGPVLEMTGNVVNPGLKTIATAMSFVSTLWSMRNRR
jgi:hypothetical protein